MPLSMKTAHEKLGVRQSIAQFIVPLGATVNMDGTALYQVIAAVFLTQVFGINLTLSDLLLLSATTIGASIGSPSTPGVGIVILATILQGIGVPVARKSSRLSRSCPRLCGYGVPANFDKKLGGS